MDSITAFLERVPDWVIGVALLLFALGVALIFVAFVNTILARITRDKPGFWTAVFHRVRRPLGLAVALIVASFAAQLPFLPDNISAATSKILTVGAILLVGWVAIVTMDIASTFYLQRYKVDSSDNLLARKHHTQVRVLRRAIDILIGLITVAAALMAFEPVRQFGVSLFASAGAAGIVVGLAARPVLSNLIAGIQLAVTQPIRMGDVVIVENEWGTIEEITASYVVIKVWDWRRLIVPLSYFMEKPFQNWTRETANVIGTVFLQTDYTVPVDKVRARLEEIVQASKLWDKQVVNLQVTDMKEGTVELRALVSAATGPLAWDLRCDVREKLLAFLQSEYPGSLPRQRVELPEMPRIAQPGNGHDRAAASHH